jgi:hypothetical protein
MADSNDETRTTRIHLVAALEIERLRKDLEAQERRRVSFVEASRRAFETSVHGGLPAGEALRRIGQWKIGGRK